jgi:NhaP-type Na+/H+ and K+/H+ antiporter
MLGVKNAIIAIAAYLLLALVVYPLTKDIIISGLNLGTWLLLLACPLFLIQALAYIKKSEFFEKE